MKVPIADGAATPIAPGGPFSPIGIAVDQDQASWTQFDGNPIWTGNYAYRTVLVHAPLAGGAPVELASRHAQSMALAFDGTDLHWGTYSTLIVYRKRQRHGRCHAEDNARWRHHVHHGEHESPPDRHERRKTSAGPQQTG